jgi:hypothetical protein
LIPTSVTVLGTPFKIQKVAKMEASGEMLGADSLIKINPKENDTRDKVQNTLIHEITHAALYLSGMSQILETHDSSGKLEEALTLLIANSLSPIVTLKCMEK